MARWRMLSTLVVTLGVLALIVAFSLRNARAASESTSAATTLVAYLPVATLVSKEAAAVHVVNLGRDNSAPAEVFSIMFVDSKNVLLAPEQVCAVHAGETCSATFDSRSCPKGQACQFRAVVVGEQMPCVTPDMGTGEWMTDLELFGTVGASKSIAGETGVLRLPTDSCNTGPDAAPPDAAFFPDAPLPDAGLPDAPPPDAPPPDAAPPDAAPPDAAPPDAAPGAGVIAAPRR